MAEAMESPMAEVAEGFECNSARAAAWAVGVIRGHRRHLADLHEQFAKQTARAEADLERALGRLEPELRGWAAAELARTPAKRHVDVATGRLQFRKVPETFKVVDDKKALAFAAKLPNGIVEQITRRIDAERVKRAAATLFTDTVSGHIIAKGAAGDVINDAVDAGREELAKIGVQHIGPHDAFDIVDGGDSK